MVYWTEIVDEVPVPCQHLFGMEEMSESLKFMEELRNSGIAQFVGMFSQNPNSVGKPGVSDKLSADYSWSKAHRAGSERGSSYSIIANRSNGD